MPIKVIVTDIEGTTTSISFVKDKLFPYAVEHVEEYLTANWTTEAVQEAVKELRAQYAVDVTDKIEGAVAISDGEAKEQAEQIAEVVANVKWQISIDRKTTSLKKLQGLIWAKGYDSGAIKGHVYSDVPKAFERWTADNIKIYIYSSGSVAAQKLLFTNSEHGDLTSNISGYFDTNVGMKQDQLSYEKIVKEVGCEPSDILFLTDIVNEAAAAKGSGIKVALLVRSGNGPLTDEEKAEYEIFTSFDDIHSEFVIGKRKFEDIVTAETNAIKIAKLSDEESVTTNDTTPESVTETNGIDRTDSINDTKMETLCSNSDELTKTKNDVKTETTDIPITQTECDHKDKTDNLDVDVVEQDIVKGEKDSKPQTEVEAAIKVDEALPMEVVDDKPVEKKETEDIEMETTPIEAEPNKKPKDINDDDELAKVVDITSDTVDKHLTDPITATPDTKSDEQTDKEELSTEKLSKAEIVAEIVDENNVEKKTEVPSQQNGDHTVGNNEEKSADETQDTHSKTEPAVGESADTTEPKKIEIEKSLDSDEKVETIEKDAKEAEEIDNKENIPVEIKEKENIIEIPIHIDGDAQKPSIITTTNGNGVATKDDALETAATAATAATTTTNSNKEKMSRIELIIEEKNNDNGQLTETTTHIVKEIIVKNNTCELVDNDKMAENV
ncbi:enolase-phosphatase E1 [Bradysia coprophila]|uniref:enolase-phosphatase E1 n=1 Tax=Bradysia coprophila TaxID=38358 RepID=UPI00187D9065|nr:enolase-phosphatase E1 [Bradysia coprophila]